MPHRVQKVAEIDGVVFYDDSKGTNVGATVAALNGMQQPVVLIAGGDGKGQDFSPLRAAVAARARAVVLIGRDREQIAQALAGSGVPVAARDDMEEAVQLGFAARAQRRRGAAVAGVRELRHVPQLRASRARCSSPRCKRLAADAMNAARSTLAAKSRLRASTIDALLWVGVAAARHSVW